MEVQSCAYATMVAWQSLFLLQYRETIEVLLPGSRLQEELQDRGPERRQMM
jgi:hypothetical protein